MLSRNLYRMKKSPLNSKRRKVIISVLLILSLSSIAYGIYYTSKLKPEDGKKEEIKIATGDQPLAKNITIYINADGGLSLRKDRDPASQRLILIPNKTKLEATQELDGWYKVLYNEKEGWISKQYTTLEAPDAVNDITTGWSAFKNSAQGYNIKYPVGWKVQDYGANAVTKTSSFVAFSNQELPTTLPAGSEFIAPITLQTSALPFEDAKNNFALISGVTMENISISGGQGVKYVYTAPSSNTQVNSIVATVAGKTYIFNEAGGYLDDLVNMIKTFSQGG